MFLLAAAGLMAAACTRPVAPQDRLLANEAEIDAVIAQMTLEEKVNMLHSKTNMSSAGVERLGIADMHYADGPFGIREEGVPDGFQSAGWQLDSATYFPTGSALAATWSEDLAYDYGTGMGIEARLRGKDVILGPAINIQRLPVGGRTYEYLSEDPALSAALAMRYTQGLQDRGTAACIKHFAVNNQETNRGSVDAQVDERTLREIYLKPFERAVREGGAMCVMPAYNKVNGDYCSENEHLLNEILRGDWGFKGYTLSDWGGTHSTMGAMLHGLNVQMTGSNYLGQPVIDSIRVGRLTEDMVDENNRYVVFDDGGWDWPLWKWKGPIVTEGSCVYGKFFAGKAGFVSKDWWPDLCNYRRASRPAPVEGSIDEAILLTLAEHGSLITRELRAACGFDGPKMRSKFDGYVTRLQMACRIVTEDFVYPTDKHGREYGWGWSLLTTPERLLGREICRCERTPQESFELMLEHLHRLLPEATDKQITKLIK